MPVSRLFRSEVKKKNEETKFVARSDVTQSQPIFTMSQTYDTKGSKPKLKDIKTYRSSRSRSKKNKDDEVFEIAEQFEADKSGSGVQLSELV